MTDSDKLEQESNEMLLRIFVSAIGFDYIAHHKRNTAQFHPDFGEDTIALWHEIESRLKQPEFLNFDAEKAYKMMEQEIEKQRGIIQQGELATISYHAGIERGLCVWFNKIVDRQPTIEAEPVRHGAYYQGIEMITAMSRLTMNARSVSALFVTCLKVCLIIAHCRNIAQCAERKWMRPTRR